jgi:hypothetical protein
MKLAMNGILVSALILGLSGTAYAQSGVGMGGGMGGVHFGSANGEGVGTGMGTGLGSGLGSGISTGLGAGMARGPATIGADAGPAANDMRANGTSLNMSPDPRAPDVAGTAFAPPQ